MKLLGLQPVTIWDLGALKAKTFTTTLLRHAQYILVLVLKRHDLFHMSATCVYISELVNSEASLILNLLEPSE